MRFSLHLVNDYPRLTGAFCFITVPFIAFFPFFDQFFFPLSLLTLPRYHPSLQKIKSEMKFSKENNLLWATHNFAWETLTGKGPRLFRCAGGFMSCCWETGPDERRKMDRNVQKWPIFLPKVSFV